MTQEFSLAHLTVLGCAPPEMTYIAARAGYDYVSIRPIFMGLPGEPNYALADNPQSMFVSKKTWDRLNKDEQQVLLDAAKEAQVYQRKFSRDAQDASLATLKKTMEYTELPPAEVAKIRTKLKPVIDKYSATVGADFAKQVYAEIDKARGK